MDKRTIELSGHIIDSLSLTKTMAIIMDKGGEFDILEIDVGRKKSDISKAKIEVSANSSELLESILDQLKLYFPSICIAPSFPPIGGEKSLGPSRLNPSEIS